MHLVSRDGACLHCCSDVQEVKTVEKVVCPFDGCTSGKYGTHMSIRPADITRLRLHLSTHVRNDKFNYLLNG